MHRVVQAGYLILRPGAGSDGFLELQVVVVLLARQDLAWNTHLHTEVRYQTSLYTIGRQEPTAWFTGSTALEC